MPDDSIQGITSSRNGQSLPTPRIRPPWLRGGSRSATIRDDAAVDGDEQQSIPSSAGEPVDETINAEGDADDYDPSTGSRVDDAQAIGSPDEIARTISLLHSPGAVFEVRTLGGTNARGYGLPPAVGYFDAIEELVLQLQCGHIGTPAGLYTTLNPPTPALLARTNNTFDSSKQTSATSDADIVCRRWLLVDFDPVRPRGISATNEEHAAAFKRAETVRDWLREEFGWPEPMLADSGNGCHLLYRVDLPNDAEATTLINACLATLDARHTNELVKIDRAVGNAGRIVRLYGTVTRKGAATCDRPHRLSYIVDAPDELGIVSRDQLDALAAAAPEPAAPAASCSNCRPNNSTGRVRVDVAAFIARHNFEVSEPREWQGGQRWIFRRSPMCEHHDRAAYIAQLANGIIAAGCHHDSCDWRWPDLRRKYESRPAEGYALTDLGNAERFVAQHGHEVRYVATWRKWLIWDGSRWAPDDTLEAVRLAKATVRSIRQQADELYASENQADRKRADQVWAWATQSEQRSRLSALLDVARSQEQVAISHEYLDTYPHLLNCVNGTVDLRAGELFPHDPAYLLTKCTGVGFPAEIDATYDHLCPTWLRFLESIFCGDAELISFIQRLCGQALIGRQDVHALPILFGHGANGKTTFVRAIGNAIGDYFWAAPANFLTVTYGEKHPTILTNLFGTRFVAVNETDETSRLDEAAVKSLTGGDVITARRCREDFCSFKPSHTAFLLTNHRPTVRGTDHGIWRRLMLIPFPQRFLTREEAVMTPGCPVQDPTILDRLKAEATGILAWLVDGAIYYQYDGGLRTPASVRAETDEYRQESDIIQLWIDACCDVVTEARTYSSALYASYKTYCDRAGYYAMSQTAWGRAMTAKGFTRHKSGVYVYHGLAVRPDSERGTR